MAEARKARLLALWHRLHASDDLAQSLRHWGLPAGILPPAQAVHQAPSATPLNLVVAALTPDGAGNSWSAHLRAWWPQGSRLYIPEAVRASLGEHLGIAIGDLAAPRMGLAGASSSDVHAVAAARGIQHLLCGARLAIANRPWPRQSMAPDATSVCLLPHQRVVADLVHAAGRVLVDYPLGAGKTWALIHTLERFMDDPRPKLVIFPSGAVAANFYTELIKWPSRLRDYFAQVDSQAAQVAAGAAGAQPGTVWPVSSVSSADMARLQARVRDALSMRHGIRSGNVVSSSSAMAAPLRSISYKRAAGQCLRMLRGQPVDPLMKVGFKQHPIRWQDHHDG